MPACCMTMLSPTGFQPGSQRGSAKPTFRPPPNWGLEPGDPGYDIDPGFSPRVGPGGSGFNPTQPAIPPGFSNWQDYIKSLIPPTMPWLKDSIGARQTLDDSGPGPQVWTTLPQGGPSGIGAGTPSGGTPGSGGGFTMKAMGLPLVLAPVLGVPGAGELLIAAVVVVGAAVLVGPSVGKFLSGVVRRVAGRKPHPPPVDRAIEPAPELVRVLPGQVSPPAVSVKPMPVSDSVKEEAAVYQAQCVAYCNAGLGCRLNPFKYIQCFGCCARAADYMQRHGGDMPFPAYSCGVANC